MALATNDRNTGRSTQNRRRHPDGVRCPFCGSFDTEFKFFNNKNINQPRYRCKYCKKFWTEGGRIRGPYRRTEEVRNPVGTDTTDTTSYTTDTTSQPSQPSVSAVSTPTPTTDTTSYTTDTTSQPSQPSVSAVSTPTPTTDTTSYTPDTTSQPSQPSVSAVSTPTPTASDGSSMGSGSLGGGSSTSLWKAMLKAAKWCQERDYPDLPGPSNGGPN